MEANLNRRGFAIGALLGAASLACPGLAMAQAPDKDELTRALAHAETALGARLGAMIIDTQTGRRWARRADERFPMCSTFKALASGALLKRVDAGSESLDRRIRFEAGEVVDYSPVTKARAGGDGMTLAELCEAALTKSDNTAGNMILRAIGGPPAVGAFARTLGDEVTRLDRWETELNQAEPGDPRDTTTPAAMASDLLALALGDALSEHSRAQFVAWVVANTTGGAKLRAGLPKDWRVGDKTGGGDHGAMADIAVLWPPNRKPLVVAIYMTETTASFDGRNAVIRRIGAAIARATNPL